MGLKSYFERPGDCRPYPQIPARDLVWSVVIGHILRVTSFLRLEWLMHSPVRAELGIKTEFGDDALAYCTERMDPEITRVALAAALHQAKRNKAFENSRFIGLALDGTGALAHHRRSRAAGSGAPQRESSPIGRRGARAL